MKLNYLCRNSLCRKISEVKARYVHLTEFFLVTDSCLIYEDLAENAEKIALWA